MALPGLNDLLPDYLFYDSSTQRPPPPPSSILQHVRPSAPLYAASASHTTTPYPPTSSSPPPTTYGQTLAYEPPLPPPPQPAFQYHQEDIGRSTPLSDVRGSGFIINDRHPSPIQIGTFYVEPNEHESDSGDANEKQSGVNERYKKHSCPACGKRFNRPSSLKIHLNTHTGAKPYMCPFPGCSRSFNVSSNMRRHYRNHAQRAPLQLQDDTVYAHWPVEPTQITPVQVPGGPFDQRVLLGEGQTPQLLKAAMTPQEQEDHRVAVANAERRVDELADGFEGASGTGFVIAKHSSPDSPPNRSYSLQAAPLASVANVGVQYVYPCPPANGGVAFHAAPCPPSTVIPYSGSYPRTTYQQHPGNPYMDEPNPTIYADARKLDVGSSRYDPHQVSSVRPTNSSPSAYIPGPKDAPESHDERCKREAQANIPPTPPYTNEAAFSPPVFMRDLVYPPGVPTYVPPRASYMHGYDSGHGFERDHAAHHADWRPRSPPDYSAYNASRRAYADSYSLGPSLPSTIADPESTIQTGHDYIAKDMRQQPSPDTPSLHVPELHEDHPSHPLGSELVCGEEKKEEALGSEKGITEGTESEDTRPGILPDRRSSLNINAIVNPTEDSPIVSKPTIQTQSSVDCALKRPSTTCPSSSPTQTSIRADAAHTEGTPEGVSNERANSKGGIVGTTPGAAPPPPYPLYKRRSSPLLEEDLEADERAAEAEAFSRVEGGRRTKKRRRG